MCKKNIFNEKNFSLIELNGLLADSIIEIEHIHDICDTNTLNFFEEIAENFSNRVGKEIEQTKKYKGVKK